MDFHFFTVEGFYSYKPIGDIDSVVGEVMGYNKSLSNYSSLAAMVNKMHHLKSKLAKRYQCWVYTQIQHK
jgi:hypothetical protein